MVGGSGRYGSLAYQRQNRGVTAKQRPVYSVQRIKLCLWSLQTQDRRSECDSGQFTGLPFQCAMLRILYDRLATDLGAGYFDFHPSTLADSSRMALPTHPGRGRIKIDTRAQGH